MFRILAKSSQRYLFRGLSTSSIYSFSVYDPYYILGVDRRAEFSEIKKAYFKLIAQYHPDKNPSPDATKKFVLIKDSFEDIKKQLGQEVKMTYDSSRGSKSSEFKTMRPDPNRYKEDFENDGKAEEGSQEQKYGKFDFREHAYKTPEGEEFDKFRDSFQNIADIEEKKFTPIDADIPDASKRFKLEEKIASNTLLPEDSKIIFMLIITAFVIFIAYMSGANSKSIKSKYDVAVYHILNKEKLEELKKDYDPSEEITRNLKKNQQYKEYTEKLQKNLENVQDRMQNRVPIIRDYAPLGAVTNKQSELDDEEEL